MQNITEQLEKKSTYGTMTSEELSADEVLLRAREVLRVDNEKHKDNIYQYLEDHRERLITKESITEFLCLLNICRSEKLIRIFTPSMNTTTGHLLPWGMMDKTDWRRVNYEAMVALIDSTDGLWLANLPIVMRWFLERPGYLDDPSNKSSALTLLSLVCVRYMPLMYRDTVLSPYLENTFLSRDVQLTNVKEEEEEGDEYYRCSRHKRCTRASITRTFSIAALPEEFYSLQEDAKLTIVKERNYHYELVLKINEDPCLTVSKVLTSRGKVVKKDWWFVLFDWGSCMDRYPAPRYSFTLGEVRDFVAKYKNLYVGILQ